MAHNTEIITTTEIKSLALPNVDFDEALLAKRVINYQRQYVRDLLGKDYYTEIITEAETSYSADNEILVTSYLKPMLAHFIMYEELPYLRNQIGSLGVRNPLDDLDGQATVSEFSHLRNKLVSDAEKMKADLIQYIKDQQEDDSSKFPLYDDCDDGETNKYFISY